ncbi:bifunctional diguanylate cyclase/phosphodiesterase [Nocardioides sp.]|uniref:bifunctional diguanylate cyclase/phosphodiesterase n=1 Tax=Nocardioides sp. TaxID=35761 RepID=UPI002734BD01|nr:bifunctional diguanylate cyclase/phosphodiesterase [Nocardioides sp.]MDP3894734.1 bifunctional diguanylate cyclase/phosphodiesterase [Nocardioides sp.]
MVDGRPDDAGASRRPALIVHGALLGTAAVMATGWGALGWRDATPEVTPVVVAALLCVPLLVRLTSVTPPPRGHLALALTPTALLADPSGGLALLPVWAAAVTVAHLLLLGATLASVTRLSITVLAGTALAAAGAQVDLGPGSGAALVPAVSCLAALVTLAALTGLDRAVTGAPSPADAPGRDLVGLGLLFLFAAALFATASSAYAGPVEPVTRVALLLALALPVVALLLAVRAAELGRRVSALVGAGSALPWTDEDTDAQLLARVHEAVPAALARIQDEPGDGPEVSIPVDGHRHVVLRRRRGDVPLTPQERRVVEALVVMAAASRDRVNLEFRLRREIVTDDLTGLWTASFFHEMLASASSTRDDGETIALLFLDLDGFAEINQQLGQLDADKVLKEIGARLLDQVPADGLPARLGGDQFALVLRHVDGPAQVLAECERIQTLVAEPISVGGQLLQIGVTIGTATSASARDDMDRVTRAASDATARRKRDRSTPGATPQWANERAFLRDLMHQRRVEVVYQPVIDLRAGRLHGYEALLRAADQDFGVLSPLMLVRAAERLSLLDELSEAVAEQAIPTMTKVAELTSLPVTLALNIEFEQLTAANPFLASLPARLEDTGIALTLELSERQFGRWAAEQDLVARDLRARGISLAVDDFGAGYSTFSLLNSWDWDWVKIDHSLVSGRDDPQGRLLLRHVAQMLDDLTMTGVAEGIETAAQLERVRGLGISFAQGTFLGGPSSAEATLADLELFGVERPAWRG